MSDAEQNAFMASANTDLHGHPIPLEKENKNNFVPSVLGPQFDALFPEAEFNPLDFIFPEVFTDVLDLELYSYPPLLAPEPANESSASSFQDSVEEAANDEGEEEEGMISSESENRQGTEESQSGDINAQPAPVAQPNIPAAAPTNNRLMPMNDFNPRTTRGVANAILLLPRTVMTIPWRANYTPPKYD